MKNKSLNPTKPWLNEPNSLIWQDKKTGLICEIHRNPKMGHLCGYVNIPENHPLIEKDYNDLNFNVHGGVTFSNKLLNSYKNCWKIGFDCAHSEDLSPFLSPFNNNYTTYKTIKYVKAECKKLAKQIWNYKN